MKKLILPILLLAAIIAKAQPNVPIDKETGHVEYVEVVNVDGASAHELYKRIYYWYHTFYTNPSGVITSDNSNENYVNGQHAITVFDTVNGTANKHGLVKYTIEVAAKDGRYRYRIKEIYYFQQPKLYVEKWLDDKAPNKAVQYGYLTQVDTYLKDLVTKLKDTMGKPIPGKKSDDF